LVGKFFKEFEAVPKECFSEGLKCGNNKCSNSKLAKLKLSAADYYYVGGSYGKSSEELIMIDLYNNGPLSLSFNPDWTFNSYSSGIYRNIPEKTWIQNGLTKPEWIKVDHSMTLVGWGEELAVTEKDENGNPKKTEMVKYWLLQNSWGESWGDNGYIKFERGIDLYGIESIAEAILPRLIEQP
jgi:cathepsin C